MNDLPDTLAGLTARLEQLELRVEALEHPAAAAIAVPPAGASLAALDLTAAGAEPAAVRPIAASEPFAGGAFPILGKALLGIAGAYVLRAVAESGSLPRGAVAAIAIVYAITWLVWAVRVPAEAWFASVTYACTSALILAPMLWELTLRFKVLSAPLAAAALGAFVCAGTLLAWKPNRTAVFWVVNATAAAVGVVLAIASHELEPFLVLLLLMALVGQVSGLLRREIGIRMVVAAAADLLLWVLVYIYTSAESTRTDYPDLGAFALCAPAIVLWMIFAVSVAIKAVVQRQPVSIFATLQTIVAFLLAAASLGYFGPSYAATLLGVVCLVLSTVAYAALFLFLDRDENRSNFRVFALWSVALFIAGASLGLSPFAGTVALGIAALIATGLGARWGRPLLDLHGILYLVAAAIASGLPAYDASALAGTLPTAPPLAVCLVSACAAICYGAGKSREGEAWYEQVFHLVSASLAIVAAAALLVHGLVGLAGLVLAPEAHHLAFIRTLITCVAALVLAYGGAHWRRMELTRLGYAALALVAAKLVFEDLRLGNLGFIAAALFLFAATLLSVPRISRMGQGV